MLSKIFWLLANPLNAIGITLMLGLVLRLKWKRVGGGLIALSVSLFLICGLFPVGDNMLTYLERQYERPATLPGNITGFVMLGGATSNSLSHHHGYTVVNGLAERIHEIMILSRHYPNAKIVFTGGSGDPSNQTLKEATYVRQIWNDMGFEDARLITEERSQNTYQNAVFTKELISPKENETWVLITSAYHMPRSMAIFDHIGWDVLAYPTDHRTLGQYGFIPHTIRFSGHFASLQVALKEYIGTAIYYLSGKSSLMFPHKIVRSRQ